MRCIVQPQGPPKLLILPLSSYPFISVSLVIVENKQTVFLVISYDHVRIVWPRGCSFFRLMLILTLPLFIYLKPIILLQPSNNSLLFKHEMFENILSLPF